MGFALSILYFVTYYLTPETIFGPLAEYRVELVLGILILLVSFPRLQRSFAARMPQSIALVGLSIATLMSVLFGMHSGFLALTLFLAFLPNAFAFFFVCLHCNTRARLKVLIAMLLFVCLFVIARGYDDLRHGIPDRSVQITREVWDEEHPYLFLMSNDQGDRIYRLRGLGPINDPNDFGQFMISVIPMLFIFWQPRRNFWVPYRGLKNLFYVLLPVSVLIYGIFLTHSRGALLALMAVAIVAARRRIGTVLSVLGGGLIFVGAMALHFTGGREVSAESGSDRTELWSQGLSILKSHPLFGVGFGNMADYTDSHHTAHNSLVVTAVELGVFGLYFWCLFLYPTLRDALVAASPDKLTEVVPVDPSTILYPWFEKKTELVDKITLNQMGRMMVLSLTGFLTAGWFLSRSFVMSLFLLGGIVEVVYELAREEGVIVPRMPFSRALGGAAILAFVLMTMMYVLLRVVGLMH
jgi:hypothetical protein